MIRLNKELGQNFLVDRGVLDTIIGYCAPIRDNIIIEVGAGTGILTERLLKEGAKVIAFEVDPHLLLFLQAKFGDKINLVGGDAIANLPTVLGELKEPYRVIANIPYQITTPLIRLLLEPAAYNPPTDMTLLIQHEVGQRLTALAKKPGRGYLSVLCQYYANMEYIRKVPPTAFSPQPKVDSAVVSFQIRLDRELPVEEEKDFLKFVRRLFVNPRKQLKNVWAGMSGMSGEEVNQRFSKLGLSDKVRAQELTLLQWLDLFQISK